MSQVKSTKVKVQRALRCIQISKHKMYVEIPEDPNEQLDSPNFVHIQPRADLPKAQQPTPVTVRNGAIWMISRDMPEKGVYPGMTLFLNLQRAATMLADGTYDIATEADIAREFNRQIEYKKKIQEDDKRLRALNSNVENTINVAPAQAPINVTIAWPEGMELVPKQKPSVEDESAPSKHRTRTTKSKSVDDEDSQTPGLSFE